MPPRLRTIAWAGALALALLAFALPAQAAPRAQSATLEVSDQPVAAGAITVAAVTAAQDGFVAAFRDNGGAPGDLLGSAPVKKGTATNVKIPLKGDVPAGTKVWVRLHIDAGTLGTLEFPGADVPAKAADGSPVQKAIAIKAAAAAPAATPTTAPAAPVSLPNTGAADGSPAAALVAALLALLAGGAMVARSRQKR